MVIWGVLVGLVVVLSGFVFVILVRRSRRSQLLSRPLPPEWQAILKKNLPMFELLPEACRERLQGYVQLFLAEKHFEGCGGVEITDEIRVTVAAQACMLLMGRECRVYPRLKTVLIYPEAYTSGQKGLLGGDNGEGSRLGESWNCGVVVLAWDSVLGGARNIEDGQNVTFHEFAHQLDQEDGASDGAPILEERSAYSAWARVCGAEFEQLVEKTERGRKSTMDRYGATNPAEFFAVATETFFEKPKQLATRHPELYEELRDYYHLDPLSWES